MAEESPANSGLLLSIERDLENLPVSTPSSGSPVSPPFIYRVPDELRRGNPTHYTPSTICIGPLHAATPGLLATQQLKIHFLHTFLSRHSLATTLDSLLQLLKEKEESARLCYADQIDLSSDEFVKMMLLDGCFILELMSKQESGQILSRRDPVFRGRATGPLLYNLQHDLLLLENQLPLLVLKALADATRPGEGSQPLVRRILTFFANFFPVGKTKLNYVDYKREPRHLLELVLFTLFSPPLKSMQLNPNPSSTAMAWNYARSISELELYGIELKTMVTHHLSDVRFSNGALTIPTLVIQEWTASLFNNLLALEHFSDEKDSCFASYLVLMSTLINNHKDVDRLLRAGVLETWFNDKQVLVSLFSNLTANVAFNKEDFPFGYVFDALNEYCSSWYVKRRAYFMRYYYESRWDILITILIFILTVTQTLFSILSYGCPKKS
ncbi:hypothetical protein NMG60_11028234 [Bertholletia excelsa]